MLLLYASLLNINLKETLVTGEIIYVQKHANDLIELSGEPMIE